MIAQQCESNLLSLSSPTHFWKIFHFFQCSPLESSQLNRFDAHRASREIRNPLPSLQFNVSFYESFIPLLGITRVDIVDIAGVQVADTTGLRAAPLRNDFLGAREEF